MGGLPLTKPSHHREPEVMMTTLGDGRPVCLVEREDTVLLSSDPPLAFSSLQVWGGGGRWGHSLLSEHQMVGRCLGVKKGSSSFVGFLLTRKKPI